jgi:glycine C-acetyltransferase
LEKTPLYKLEWNTKYFKAGMKKAGFDIVDGDSAIVPVMLYDAKLSQTMADELLKEFMLWVLFLWYQRIRIRVQLSATH